MENVRTRQSLALTYLPPLLTLGLLTLFCWMLAQWTWLVFAPKASLSSAAAEPITDMASARESIARARLFDSPSGTSQEVTARSTLNVRLVGVLQSSGKGPAFAIMNLNGKANELYGEGKEISSGVVLQRILRDHVVIRREGVLERVDFPDNTAAARSAAASNLNVTQQAAGQFTVSRDTLTRAIQDPAQLSQLSTLTVVPGAGVSIGLITPGSLMQKLGLQPGDTIKVVNGETLNSQDDLPRLYQKFASTGQVTLEGSRAGAPLKLSYSVKP